jgi:hypothetical protein
VSARKRPERRVPIVDLRRPVVVRERFIGADGKPFYKVSTRIPPPDPALEAALRDRNAVPLVQIVCDTPASRSKGGDARRTGRCHTLLLEVLDTVSGPLAIAYVREVNPYVQALVPIAMKKVPQEYGGVPVLLPGADEELELHCSGGHPRRTVRTGAVMAAVDRGRGAKRPVVYTVAKVEALAR